MKLLAHLCLVACGKVTMPFQQIFWAHRFGMCTDRFGIPWMINCELAP
jgi:PhnB protein